MLSSLKTGAPFILQSSMSLRSAYRVGEGLAQGWAPAGGSAHGDGRRWPCSPEPGHAGWGRCSSPAWVRPACVCSGHLPATRHSLLQARGVGTTLSGLASGRCRASRSAAPRLHVAERGFITAKWMLSRKQFTRSGFTATARERPWEPGACRLLNSTPLVACVLARVCMCMCTRVLPGVGTRSPVCVDRAQEQSMGSESWLQPSPCTCSLGC